MPTTPKQPTRPAVAMTYDHLYDKDLLAKLIGVREAQRVYHGSLLPLFTHQPEAGPTSEKCAVARELVIGALTNILQNVLSAHRSSNV